MKSRENDMSRMTCFGLVAIALQAVISSSFYRIEQIFVPSLELTYTFLWLNRDRTAAVSNMLQIIDGYLLWGLGARQNAARRAFSQQISKISFPLSR